MLGKGFEQFNSVNELIGELGRMAGQFPGKGAAYYYIQGTPAESLYPGKNISYNGDLYDFTGWGPDRNSPWGPLPAVIVAVRSDLAKLIRGDHPVQKALEEAGNKPVFDLPKSSTSQVGQALGEIFK